MDAMKISSVAGGDVNVRLADDGMSVTISETSETGTQIDIKLQPDEAVKLADELYAHASAEEDAWENATRMTRGLIAALLEDGDAVLHVICALSSGVNGTAKDKKEVVDDVLETMTEQWFEFGERQIEEQQRRIDAEARKAARNAGPTTPKH